MAGARVDGPQGPFQVPASNSRDLETPTSSARKHAGQNGIRAGKEPCRQLMPTQIEPVFPGPARQIAMERSALHTRDLSELLDGIELATSKCFRANPDVVEERNNPCAFAVAGLGLRLSSIPSPI